ncbi:MAG: flagellar filament capping protein FliD [Phycisphaerales bacterium JB059]
MSGITTGVGLFSGIDSASIIEQLLAVEARPRQLAESRLVQLQSQQAAYLDLNSRMNTLKSAAAKFRTSLSFLSKTATSSNPEVLSATASTDALQGSYTFVVDRLVTSQQLLSRGFADTDSSAAGIDELTFEDARGRLDRDTSLSLLNDGAGIDRGVFSIDTGSGPVEVDLSRASTVSDVLDAINNSGAGVTASVRDGAFVLSANNPLSTITVSDVGLNQTASSLGIEGTSAGSLTGDSVYRLNANTALSALNDGAGVGLTTGVGENRHDFKIDVNGVIVNVNLGDVYELEDEELTITEAAVSTLGGAIQRINDALDDAGVTTVNASINDTTGAIEFSNTAGRPLTFIENGATTARDLGLTTDTAFTDTAVTGRRVLAGLNETLLSSLNGGAGLAAQGTIDFTDRNGVAFSVDTSGLTTTQAILDEINAQATLAGADVTASLNSVGTGISITDASGGGLNLIVTSADSTAADLGIETGPTGVAESQVDSGSLQLRYISESTLLADLNNGNGLGEGRIEFTDSNGKVFEVDIGDDARSLGDIIDEINGQAGAAGSRIVASINETGDGLLITEPDDGLGGGVAIQVADTEGTIARDLRIAGESESTDSGLNRIDGTFETHLTFDPADTLEDVVQAINAAEVGVSVSILNTGDGGSAHRLSFTSEQSGRSGRFTLDAHGFDLGLDVLSEGDDAIVFFGSTDPAQGVLLQSDSNAFDDTLTGVTIDLNSASETPVTLSITRDNEQIESDIDALIKAFNDVIDRIDLQTRYDEDTGARGPLLGDGTAVSLRSQLFAEALGANEGFRDTFNTLTEVGITVGEGGKLSFDRDRFRDALAQDPDAVAELFTRRTIDTDAGSEVVNGVTVSDPNAATEYSELGIVVKLEEFANRYINSIDGVLKSKQDALDRQITLQQDRIEAINVKLENRRTVLERQFLAMEQAIGELQSMNASLASIGLAG